MDPDYAWLVAFLPTVVALLRRHHQTSAIFALNLGVFTVMVSALLGFAFWFAALVWSWSAVQREGPALIVIIAVWAGRVVGRYKAWKRRRQGGTPSA